MLVIIHYDEYVGSIIFPVWLLSISCQNNVPFIISHNLNNLRSSTAHCLPCKAKALQFVL